MRNKHLSLVIKMATIDQEFKIHNETITLPETHMIWMRKIFEQEYNVVDNLHLYRVDIRPILNDLDRNMAKTKNEIE